MIINDLLAAANKFWDNFPGFEIRLNPLGEGFAIFDEDRLVDTFDTISDAEDGMGWLWEADLRRRS